MDVAPPAEAEGGYEGGNRGIGMDEDAGEESWPRLEPILTGERCGGDLGDIW